MRIHVELDADTRLLYEGDDVDFFVSEDGVLSVYNYDLRNQRPGHSGLVLVASKGYWRYVRELT